MFCLPDRRQKFLLALIIFATALLLISCASEEAAWQAAEQEGTIESYAAYLSKYPKGKHVKEAMKTLEELVWRKAEVDYTIESFGEYLELFPEGEYAWLAKEIAFYFIAHTSTEDRTEAEIGSYYADLVRFAPDEVRDASLILSEKWNELNGLRWVDDNRLEADRPQEVIQAAETIWDYTEQRHRFRLGVYLASPKARITVEQGYEKADLINLPFYKYAEIILKNAGFEVVKADATAYDATLHIEAMGIPDGSNYEESGGSTSAWHWTKAIVRGNISFSAENKTRRWEFSGTEGPIGIIFKAYPTPNHAPFEEAFYQGFVPELFKAVVEMKGFSPLIATLLDDVSNQRQDAARVLIEFGDPAVEPLINALKNENYIIRQQAAMLLGKIGDTRAVEPLISAFKDVNVYVASYASNALVKIGEPAVEPLIAALQDEDWQVRVLAARALGKIGDARAVEPLVAAREDEDSRVQKEIDDALKKFGWMP